MAGGNETKEAGRVTGTEAEAFEATWLARTADRYRTLAAQCRRLGNDDAAARLETLAGSLEAECRGRSPALATIDLPEPEILPHRLDAAGIADLAVRDRQALWRALTAAAAAAEGEDEAAIELLASAQLPHVVALRLERWRQARGRPRRTAALPGDVAALRRWEEHAMAEERRRLALLAAELDAEQAPDLALALEDLAAPELAAAPDAARRPAREVALQALDLVDDHLGSLLAIAETGRDAEILIEAQALAERALARLQLLMVAAGPLLAAQG
jgi:hypothetical protein